VGWRDRWRGGWVGAREALLDRLAGTSARVVLNPPVDVAPAALDVNLGAELRAAVNAFQTEAISPDGRQVDYRRLRESEEYARYRSTCSPRLRSFDPATLSTRAERLAFWINLYNALVVDAVIAFAVRRSVAEGRLGLLAFFRRAAYEVGGRRVSCDDIEHGILRGNRGHPLLPGPQFAPHDARRAWVVNPPEIRIHFALNCASRSCPPIGVYRAGPLEQQLNVAARHFVAATTQVDAGRGELRLSPLFRWYQRDFGGHAGVMAFVRAHLPDGTRQAWLHGQRARARVVYTPYDWGLNA
jgi:hypothetical protein